LRCKLHSARLRDEDSAQEHIKLMTEIFDALTVAGETVSEEDRVVYLLASLPESYGVLVTALEASETVPSWKSSRNAFFIRKESSETGVMPVRPLRVR
jgi:hypothetical protein